MNPKLFKKTCQTLFPGYTWKNLTAKALGVSRETIKRWADGDYLVPHDKQIALYKLVQQRLTAMRRLLENANR